MRCDLHLHSTASDGALSPSELVHMLRAAGVEAFSLTDHDTLAGLREAHDTALKLGVAFVPGVEISTALEGFPLHILGYGFGLAPPALLEPLAAQLQAREERVMRVVARLNALGVPLSASEVLAAASGGAPGRVHIARALLARGSVASLEQAFDRYLGNRAPAYVAKRSPPPAQAVRWIHEAGGVAVWAHPLAQATGRSLAATARELRRQGLDGIELEHPAHDANGRRRLRRVATELGLLVTGGSDFHAGPGETPASLGPPGVTAEMFAALTRA